MVHARDIEHGPLRETVVIECVLWLVQLIPLASYRLARRRCRVLRFDECRHHEPNQQTNHAGKQHHFYSSFCLSAFYI